MSFNPETIISLIEALATQFANVCAIIYLYNRNKKAGEIAFVGLFGNPLMFALLFIPVIRNEVATYIGHVPALGLLVWHFVFFFVSLTVALLNIWRSMKLSSSSKS